MRVVLTWCCCNFFLAWLQPNHIMVWVFAVCATVDCIECIVIAIFHSIHPCLDIPQNFISRKKLIRIRNCLRSLEYVCRVPSTRKKCTLWFVVFFVLHAQCMSVCVCSCVFACVLCMCALGKTHTRLPKAGTFHLIPVAASSHNSIC